MSSASDNLDQTFSSANRARRNSRSRYPQRGFGYLELIIVVGLLGIVTAFAVPAVARTLELHRLDTCASILASKLTEARMNAIKRNRQAWLAINPANRTMQIQTTDNAGSTINIGASETLSQGVSFASPSTVAQVRFDSLGRLPTGTPAWALILQGAQNTKRKNVTVSAAGKIGVGNMNSHSQQMVVY